MFGKCTHQASIADLPGDQCKDKTYKPPRKSPALSEDSVPAFTLDEEGLEIVNEEADAGQNDGDEEESNGEQAGSDEECGEGGGGGEREGSEDGGVNEEETVLRKVRILNVNALCYQRNTNRRT